MPALPTRTLIDQVITLVELLYVNTGAVASIELDSRAVQFPEDKTTLTTEGTTSVHERDLTDKVRCTVENQVFSEALQAIGMSAYDATSKTGYFDGTAGKGNFGLRLTFAATDEATGAGVTITREYPIVTVKSYTSRDGAQRRQVPTQRVEFNAVKTTKDLLGVALSGTGIPATGVYFIETEV